MKRQIPIVLIIFMIVMLAATVCYGQTINACVHKTNGKMRYVPSGKCKPTEYLVSWGSFDPTRIYDVECSIGGPTTFCHCDDPNDVLLSVSCNGSLTTDQVCGLHECYVGSENCMGPFSHEECANAGLQNTDIISVGMATAFDFGATPLSFCMNPVVRIQCYRVD